jgi:uncharacterized protein YecT (DUF1311 family)
LALRAVARSHGELALDADLVFEHDMNEHGGGVEGILLPSVPTMPGRTRGGRVKRIGKRETTMIKAAALVASTVGVIFLASATHVQAQGRPSWCGSQESLNPAERTICQTRALWDLDYQMNIIYQSALQSVGGERSRLQRSQEDWVRVTRNGCNEDDDCLRDVYERRIAIVRSIDNRGSIEPNGIH